MPLSLQEPFKDNSYGCHEFEAICQHIIKFPNLDFSHLYIKLIRANVLFATLGQRWGGRPSALPLFWTTTSMTILDGIYRRCRP